MAKKKANKNRSARERARWKEELAKRKEKEREKEQNKDFQTLAIAYASLTGLLFVLALAGVFSGIESLLFGIAILLTVFGAVCVWSVVKYDVPQAKPLAVNVFVCAALLIVAYIIAKTIANG